MVAAFALMLAGCGSGNVVGAFPETVQGTVAAGPKGNAAAGKKLFVSNACGGCHAFTPAGTSANVGPKLDDVEQDAKKANQGTVDEYVHTSIVNPEAYTVPGFQKGVMPSYSQLSEKQVADLVAFITQS